MDRKQRFLFLTMTVLLISCPIGPSIPTEALLCITGKTKGTAKIEAVGGNVAMELFSVTADGEEEDVPYTFDDDAPSDDY